MAELVVSLLGGMEVTLDGRRVRGFVSRKAEAVLVYLVCTARPVPRTTLATLLWGDSPQQRALANLSVVLSNLRKLLPGYLVGDRQVVEFVSWPGTVVDINQFTGEHWDGEKLSRPEAEQIAKAVKLYRGSFLAGFEVRKAPDFEAWVRGKQAHFHRWQLDALQALMAFSLTHREWAEGIGYGKQALVLEAWHEPTHRWLMRLFVASGQRGEALAQYGRCVQILADELGVEPAGETTALYEQIKTKTDSATFAPRHNLPAQFKAFVGRDEELARFETWLNTPHAPLLTIMAPGGMGKTQLALQGARQSVGMFRDGVWFVSLVGLRSGREVVQAIAEVMGWRFSGQASDQSELLALLRQKRLLLVLDNFEHLIDDPTVDLLAQITLQAPGVKVCVTSRERLRLQAEVLLDLRGLAYPAGADDPDFAHYPASQFFVQRAQRTAPSYQIAKVDEDALARLCALVDGLPLALELAATWVEMLPLSAIVERIENDPAGVATTLRDIPDRHRNLWIVFDTSWQLLTEEEQDLLARLALFRDGFDLPAGEAILQTTALHLQTLIDKSLLYQTGYRFQQHPLIAQYTQTRWNTYRHKGNISLPTLERTYSTYYLSWLATQESFLKQATAKTVVRQINADWVNIRQAWEWATNHHLFPLLEASLSTFTNVLGYLNKQPEGLALLTRTLTKLPLETTEQRRLGARLQASVGHLTLMTTAPEKAISVTDKALQLAFSVEDLPSIVEGLWRKATVHRHLGQDLDSRKLYQQALSWSQEHGLEEYLAESHRLLGRAMMEANAYTEAESNLLEAMSLFQQQGHHLGEGRTLGILGVNAYYAGQYESAAHYFQEQIVNTQTSGAILSEAGAQINLGNTWLRLGRYEQSEHHMEQARRCYGPASGSYYVDLYQCLLYHQLGNNQKAQSYLKRAFQHFSEQENNRFLPTAHLFWGHLLAEATEWEKAEQHYDLAIIIWQKYNKPHHIAEARTGMARVALQQNRLDTALALISDMVDQWERFSVDIAEEPFRIYLSCTQVLQENGDPRTVAFTDRAVNTLLGQAQLIKDARLRDSFLNNVPYHQQLLALDDRVVAQ